MNFVSRDDLAAAEESYSTDDNAAVGLGARWTILDFAAAKAVAWCDAGQDLVQLIVTCFVDEGQMLAILVVHDSLCSCGRQRGRVSAVRADERAHLGWHRKCPAVHHALQMRMHVPTCHHAAETAVVARPQEPSARPVLVVANVQWCCALSSSDSIWAMDYAQGGLLQCGFVLSSGLLLWAFRTQDDTGYTGYSNY